MTVILGGGSSVFPQLTITTSQTWVPPQDGNVCIHAVGAGGGGLGTTGGGGAGAYFKIPTLAVTTSGSFTLVVGVGGAGVSGAADSTTGTSGGNTTVAGTGLTGTKTAAGGAGMATGAAGQLNYGAGGAVSGSGESFAGFTGGAGNLAGGGAVGVYATGNAGGANYVVSTAGMTDARAGGIGASGFGIICGGSNKTNRQSIVGASAWGEDLCGSPNTAGSLQSGVFVGGNAGIGGGGGGGAGGGLYSSGHGGRGGDGIILIQYLPW